jgi:hypothetical protein
MCVNAAYKASRLAVKYSPPTLFLEYTDTQHHTRVRAVSDATAAAATALSAQQLETNSSTCSLAASSFLLLSSNTTYCIFNKLHDSLLLQVKLSNISSATDLDYLTRKVRCSV